MTCSLRSCDFRSLRAEDAKVLPSNPLRERLYLRPTDAAVCDLQPARVATAFVAKATALRNSLFRPRFRSRRQPAFCCVSRVRMTRRAKCGFAPSGEDDSKATVAAGCVLRKPPEELLRNTARTLATHIQRSARRGPHSPKLPKNRVILGKFGPERGCGRPTRAASGPRGLGSRLKRAKRVAFGLRLRRKRSASSQNARLCPISETRERLPARLTRATTKALPRRNIQLEPHPRASANDVHTVTQRSPQASSRVRPHSPY